MSRSGLLMFVGLFLALTSNAYAGEVEAGIEAAEKMCGQLYYSSQQEECARAMKDATFISEKAVKVCADLYYASEKIECLSVIVNRRYTDEGIKVASEKYYASQKIEALKNRGHKVSKGGAEENEIDKAFVKTSIQKAMELMREGKNEKARTVLAGLLESLE